MMSWRSSPYDRGMVTAQSPNTNSIITLFGAGARPRNTDKNSTGTRESTNMSSIMERRKGQKHTAGLRVKSGQRHTRDYSSLHGNAGEN